MQILFSLSFTEIELVCFLYLAVAVHGKFCSLVKCAILLTAVSELVQHSAPDHMAVIDYCGLVSLKCW